MFDFRKELLLTSAGGTRKGPPPSDLPSPSVFDYLAFGGILRSELPLPELEPSAAGAPSWTVRLAAPHTLEPDFTAAGSEVVYDDVHARLWRAGLRWRVEVDDTGSYDWDPATREIACAARADATDDFIRGHLLGRVLATCLHDEGLLVLHGSAVTIAGGAIAFLAPKGSGKSTLAAMLVAAGAQLLTDDALAVEPDEPVRARPGVHSFRLRADTMELTGSTANSDPREDGKFLVGAPRSVAREPVPLKAIYLLAPVRWISEERAVARVPLAKPTALAALVGHTKIGAMLGPQAAPELLRRAAAVSQRVPVERLLVVREVDALPAVVAQILDWHGGH
mgnify:CR=1 FL=1